MARNLCHESHATHAILEQLRQRQPAALNLKLDEVQPPIRRALIVSIR
jgi:hypothetical protein